MNQTNTQEKLSHMFLKVNDRLAFCKLCSKHIELVESIEIEFWKHQSVKEHLEYLIHYFMFNQSGERKQSHKKKKNAYEHFVDENNFERQKQKTFKTLNKRQKLISSTFLEQQNKFLQNQNSSDQESSKNSNSDNKSELNLLDQSSRPSLSKFNQSMLNYETFKTMTEKYFVDLIKQLKDKFLYVEAICYILARIGTTTQELCCISFEKIESEIKEKSKTDPKFITKLILDMFKEMFPIVKQQYEVKNEGYLFQQPVSKERVQDFLLRAKKKLIAAATDEEYKIFIQKVQIRCFNSQYTQKNYLSYQTKRINKQEENEKKIKNLPKQEQMKRKKQVEKTEFPLNDESNENDFQIVL